jgi:hypothetical protein
MKAYGKTLHDFNLSDTHAWIFFEKFKSVFEVCLRIESKQLMKNGSKLLINLWLLG